LELLRIGPQDPYGLGSIEPPVFLRPELPPYVYMAQGCPSGFLKNLDFLGF